MAAPTRQGGAPVPAQAGPPARLTENDLEVWLGDYVPNIKDSLPASVGMDARQFLDVAMLAIRKMDRDLRSKILACTKSSILFSIQEAASFGFRLGGSMAEGYLIPYGTECTFMPDYKGFLKLARRSGAFQIIEAVEVYQSDTLRVFRDPTPKIHHEPCLDGNRGDLVGVYAYVVLQSGQIAFEHMPKSEIEKVRMSSKAPGSPAWKNWYGQMGCKSVLKRLLKRQERSVELTRAIDIDDREFETTGQANVTTAPAKGMAGLSSRLGLEEVARAPSPTVTYSEADDVPPAEPAVVAGDASEVWEAGRQ